MLQLMLEGWSEFVQMLKVVSNGVLLRFEGKWPFASGTTLLHRLKLVKWLLKLLKICVFFRTFRRRFLLDFY